MTDEISVTSNEGVALSSRMKPKQQNKEPAMDRCQTPSYALTPLKPYIPQTATVWEPAAGEGYLAQALFDNNAGTVISSDILTGNDFFTTEPPFTWDMIITNPPYSIKYKWLQRCYELGKPYALLVPVETIGANAAQMLFKQYGVELLLLSRRVNFKMPNKGWVSSAQFPVLWLCWKMLPAPIMFGDITYTPVSEYRG